MNNEGKKKSLKKRIIIITGVIALCIAAALVWYYSFKKPHEQAVANYSATVLDYNKKIPDYNNIVAQYNTASSTISDANKELDTVIETAQKIIDSGEKPYDESILVSVTEAISNAESLKIQIPESVTELNELQVTQDDTSLKTDELNSNNNKLIKNLENLDSEIKSLEDKTKKISVKPDYSKCILAIQNSQKELEDSIAIYKQIENPSEDFVKEKLSTVEQITDMAAVTEDNDPNGNLNKAGGYTSTVYFSVSLIDQSSILGDDVIDKGTLAGGSIEVYASVEDAEKRNTYLASLDGTILTSGSHIVLGTIVIRTSDELTASQQKELEKQIIESFTTL